MKAYVFSEKGHIELPALPNLCRYCGFEILEQGYIREIEKTIREKYAGTIAGVPKICDVLSMRER